MPGGDPPRADLVVSGRDAPELAAVLRWPALEGGSFGWRGLPRATALLRGLQARRAVARLGLEVVLESPA